MQKSRADIHKRSPETRRKFFLPHLLFISSSATELQKFVF